MTQLRTVEELLENLARRPMTDPLVTASAAVATATAAQLHEQRTANLFLLLGILPKNSEQYAATVNVIKLRLDLDAMVAEYAEASK
jgi:hypothetical protein